VALTWENGRYTASYGSVGTYRLFTVAQGSVRHEDGRNWVLDTTLPVYISEDKRWKTEEEAKQAAEVELEKFLAYIAKHRNDS
jgi:hypothetical protein